MDPKSPTTETRMKFSTDLWDGFPLVTKKTECGLQSCKDILQFYRKRAQIEEEYSKAMVKLCISATSEKRMIFKGRGSGAFIAESPSIMHAWETVIATTEKMAKSHGEMGKKISEQCAEPVASFIKDMERQREKTVQDGQKATKEYEDALAAVEKTKQSYHRACLESELAEKEQAENKGRDSKVVAKANAAAEKLRITEFDYRDKIQTSNTVQEKWLKEAMPKALDELQHWESVRSGLIKSNIKKYMFACEKVPDSWRESLTQISKGIEVIDSTADIERFAEENKTYNVPPPPTEFEAYVPGNVSVDKKKFSLDNLSSGLGSLAKKASSLSANAISSAANLASGNSGNTSFNYVTKEEKKEGVFEVSLEEVMQLQKDQPELEVPKILVVLTESVVSLGGRKTEGIFRVPASASEVQVLKKQINSGKYELDVNDVNVPAALLKLWFRSLPDALVPTPLYDLALNASGPDGAVAVFNKLPPLNAKVVKHLVNFLAMMAEPEVSKVTLMTLENLAMVFAPSLLRCPSDDPLMMMANAKKESGFLKNLILGLSGNTALTGNPTEVVSPVYSSPPASQQDSDDPAPPLPTRSALSRSNSQEILANTLENES